jgi:sulfotransferase family protein
VGTGQTHVFLFSLPRSGSTLTQRLLATHQEVATASEPWILLPYLYALRDHGVCADYEHNLAVEGIEDFCRLMPDGEEGYLSGLREFVLRLYAKASGGSTRHFLDKTPPYTLVANEVMQLFPEGKTIVLWRNPLATLVSLSTAPWSNETGEWNIYHYELQLFEELESLVEAYRQQRARIHVVRYEDIVADPHGELAKIFAYLELPYDPATLENVRSVTLEGKLGDPFGVHLYDRVSAEPLEKWKRTLTNPSAKPSGAATCVGSARSG